MLQQKMTRLPPGKQNGTFIHCASAQARVVRETVILALTEKPQAVEDKRVKLRAYSCVLIPTKGACKPDVWVKNKWERIQFVIVPEKKSICYWVSNITSLGGPHWRGRGSKQLRKSLRMFSRGQRRSLVKESNCPAIHSPRKTPPKAETKRGDGPLVALGNINRIEEPRVSSHAGDCRQDRTFGLCRIKSLNQYVKGTLFPTTYDRGRLCGDERYQIFSDAGCVSRVLAGGKQTRCLCTFSTLLRRWTVQIELCSVPKILHGNIQQILAGTEVQKVLRFTQVTF